MSEYIHSNINILKVDHYYVIGLNNFKKYIVFNILITRITFLCKNGFYEHESNLDE